jgi:WD40 repeat protein/tRNA A-37 threonylcarbamoyl transferase component Bud32
MNGLMAKTTTCPDCGSALPADAPQGFCPQCLMAAGATFFTQAGQPRARGVAEGYPASGSPDLGGIDAVPPSFGDYELLEEIARGGMGVVYKARQKSLDRIVAVKMILAGQFATKQFVQRFRSEAAAAAVLQHPNIVAIHEVGVHTGQHFFSMDYVEGQNLAQLVGQKPLLPRQAVRYLKLIAEAIHYAHQQGILHRDLKPSNVLVDSATDQPRITDFGLARRLDGDSSLTVTGQVLGSPNFMPPEQAGSGHGNIGRHSDVYGLGAILYYLLTARAPFHAESLEATVTQVVNAEPISPRLLNPAVPRDLETICLKCLEKEPSRRYPTAQELADELGRFLQDEPILARPVSRAERVWRWCRRKPGLAATGATALLLLLVVVVGSPIAIIRINAARVEATTARAKDEFDLYAADMKLVSEAVRGGAYGHARELLEAHRPRRGQADLRGFEWRYFWKVVEDHEATRTLAGLPQLPGWNSRVCLTRKGTILYNQSGNELRAWDMTSWQPLPLARPPQPNWVEWEWNPPTETAYALDYSNATLTVYHLPRFDPGSTLHLPSRVSALATSADGEWLAAGIEEGGKHSAMVWDLGRAALIAKLGAYSTNISQLVFSPDKTKLGVICADGALGLWDIGLRKNLPAPPSQGRFYNSSEFFPDGTRLLFQQRDDLMGVWDIASQTASMLAPGGVRQTRAHGFSPDGRLLVTSANRQDLYLFDAGTLQLVGILRGHRGLVRACGYSPDGKLLATAAVDQTARVWNLANQQEIATLGGFGERLEDVTFSADGQSIVLAGPSGTLKVYDRSKVVNWGLFAHGPDPMGIRDLALSPDQRTLATRNLRKSSVTLWDRASRNQVRSVDLDDWSYGNLAFSPDGKSLAWLSTSGLRILSLDSGKVTAIALQVTQDESDVAFSPDSRELAYGYLTQLRVLDLRSQHSQTLAVTDDEITAVNYSPDGQLLAFGDRLGSIILCDYKSKQVLSKQAKVHGGHVLRVVFSPDGRLLATSGVDASIKLWRVGPRGLTLGRILLGHLGYIAALAFSPDGTRLVSGAGDKTLKIWDVAAGVEVATLYGHIDYLGSAKFTRDGNTIYSAGFGADNQIRFWPAAPMDSLEPKTRSQARPR